MVTSLRVLVVLLAFALMAGCMGGGKSASPTLSTAPVEMGAIQGRVVDDEQRPVEGATVTLTEAGRNTTTTGEGTFRFDDLVAGTHTLAAEKPGHARQTARVDVRVGEITQATAILSRIEISVPYVEVLPFEGHIQYGWEVADPFLTQAGQSGCLKCSFRFNASADVVVLVSEIFFRPTVDNPHGPEKQRYDLFDQTGTKRYSPAGQYWPPRGKIELTKLWPAQGETFLHVHGCDVLWVCVDQKFSNYVSLFHVEGAPEKYSALPPV